MDRAVWQAVVHSVEKSRTRLNMMTKLGMLPKAMLPHYLWRSQKTGFMFYVSGSDAERSRKEKRGWHSTEQTPPVLFANWN